MRGSFASSLPGLVPSDRSGAEAKEHGMKTRISTKPMRRAEQEPPFVSWTYLLGLGLALLLSSQATAQTTFQPNTDRRSPTDYEEFPMTRPNPQLCLDACLNNAPCRSWTFVKTPDGGADCRLGNQKHEPVRDACCTSGTR